MFDNIDYEKYLGTSYDTIYNSIFNLKLYGKSHNTVPNFSAWYGNSNIAVEREYIEQVVKLVASINMEKTNCQEGTKKFLDMLFCNWMHELYRAHLHCSAGLRRKNNHNGLSSSALDLVDSFIKENVIYWGNRKHLSAVPCYTKLVEVDGDEYGWDLTKIGDTEEDIIKYFIECFKLHTKNKVTVYYYEPLTIEEMHIKRINEIRHELKSFIKDIDSDEELEDIITELRELYNSK